MNPDQQVGEAAEADGVGPAIAYAARGRLGFRCRKPHTEPGCPAAQSLLPGLVTLYVTDAVAFDSVFGEFGIVLTVMTRALATAPEHDRDEQIGRFSEQVVTATATRRLASIARVLSSLASLPGDHRSRKSRRAISFVQRLRGCGGCGFAGFSGESLDQIAMAIHERHVQRHPRQTAATGRRGGLGAADEMGNPRVGPICTDGPASVPAVGCRSSIPTRLGPRPRRPLPLPAGQLASSVATRDRRIDGQAA